MTDEVSSAGLQLARRLVAAALELEDDTVDAQAQIVELPGFDSLAYERLVAGVEDHLGREIDPLMMVSVDTVADLATALENSGSQEA